MRQHPNWSAFIVFGLSLGESLPLVSLVLPFWAMLVGIGTIIAVADPLIFWTIVAAAAIGAEVSLQLPELVKIVGSVLAEAQRRLGDFLWRRGARPKLHPPGASPTNSNQGSAPGR